MTMDEMEPYVVIPLPNLMNPGTWEAYGAYYDERAEITYQVEAASRVNHGTLLEFIWTATLV